MHFKKLDIFGFKSFADRTKLYFKKGVCAIVGPNGVGKSNIAEAIRWVLGEQSAHNLRASSMKEVIFNGTGKRKPLGLAEVALTFYNGQKIIPLDYEEVTIKRRVFRSGENEYFLNNIPCRLKDITSLFLNTGIGSNTYSLVDQKDIESLLSSRPEEKRELFERVAGIGGYRQKKKEALRRLEQTERNLVRVNDIISELKSQITIWQREASKARQYKEKMERLSALKVKFYAFEYKRMHRESKELLQEKDALLTRKEKLEKIVQEIEGKKEAQNAQLSMLENRLAIIYQSKLKLERAKERSRNQLIFNKMQIEEAEKKLKRIKEEIEEINKNIDRVTQELANKTSLITTLRHQISLKEKEREKNTLKKIVKEEREGGEDPTDLYSALEEILKQIEEVDKEIERVNRVELLKRRIKDCFLRLRKRLEQIFLPLWREKRERENIELSSLKEKERLETEMESMLKKKLEEEIKKKNQKEKEIAEIASEKKKWEEEISKAEKEEKGFISEEREIEERMEEITRERKALTAFIEEKREKEKEIAEEISALSQQISVLQLRYQKVCLEKDSIAQRMKEEYNLDIQEVAVEEIDKEKVKQEIEKLHKAIEGLGKTSFTAIEEEERLQTRLSFLQEQRDDLLLAKKRVQQAIINMDRQAKEMFTQSLRKVEEEFNRFFNLLFFGGEAKIEKEGDELEPKIRIIVHPPGKRLQDALLLSAGERALTTIALLFALFRVKPAPFCVLDEIDASLDDNNVERFVHLLKEFTQNTQFIIITHNKKTISIADIIYGVTMEEKGISKLVSVDFTEQGGELWQRSKK
ncbi:MAG: hypothetical protein DRP75_00285 [Candidatus Omnitrophota bacterium]|nr:MAG: hypothetical protein DRP75_00285 [Candidatus Omnitrophota bacterium]